MATSTFVPFDALLENMAEGVHNMQSHAFIVALCAAANAPDAAADAVLADLSVIAYTFLSSRALTVTSSSQTAGLYKWVLQDLTLTATGGTAAGFRYPVIYNDTPTSPADPLVGFLDYGSDLALGDGESLVFDFDGTEGVLQMEVA